MGRGSWVVGRGSWVVGRESCVGRGSWAVGRGSWVVVRGSRVMGRGSWVVGRGSWVVEFLTVAVFFSMLSFSGEAGFGFARFCCHRTSSSCCSLRPAVRTQDGGGVRVEGEG